MKKLMFLLGVATGVTATVSYLVWDAFSGEGESGRSGSGDLFPPT